MSLRTWSSRRRVLLAPLAAVVLVLSPAAGCGLLGGGPPGSSGSHGSPGSHEAAGAGSTQLRTPEGFTRVTPDGMSVAYPESWTTSQDSAGGWAFTAQAVRGSNPYAQLSVLADLPNTKDAVVAANTALGFIRWAEDFERTGEGSLDVPGAYDAYRIDYRFRASKGKGNDKSHPVVVGTDIAVVDRAGKAVVIRITRQKGQLDPGTLKPIINSIEMTAK